MKKVILFGLCSVMLVMSACIKPGKGGKAILSVHVFEDVCTNDGSNHTVIPFAFVYIKYGGTEVEHATNAINVIDQYDATQTADQGGKTIFENLKRGDYYLYAVDVTGTKTGGEHFEIKNRIGEREVVICTGEY